jgi:hypothetical protein
VPNPRYPGSIYPHSFPFSSIATSGACAEVAGTLALLKSFYREATPSFLETELARGAMPLNPSEQLADSLGAGVANPYRSLTQWGTISQNTTWSNAVYVSGDLAVASGATLTINPGTTVYIMPHDNEHTGNDTTRVEFWVNGVLDVNGTSGSPVHFVAWADSGEVSDSTLWQGIHVFDTQGSGASLEYCTIKNAVTGIGTNTSIKIDHCTVEDCAKRGISVAYADSVYIGYTTIRDIGPADESDAFGLNVVAGSTVRIEHSTIENVGTNACQVLSGSTLNATYTHFRDSDKGVYVWRDYSGSVDATVQYCTIRHNDHGVWVKGPGVSQVLFKQNSIDSNTMNVYCENAA